MIIGQRPGRGRTGQPADGPEKGTFTLNSNRPVSGAGSGIVAGPDRVRRGQEGTRGGDREEGGGGGGQGHRLPPGSWGATPVGGPERVGEVLAGFLGVQMLNMQMSNRIVRP